ncbi:MAG: sigma factor-like helix-turn-helix DNA-binding protein [Thermoanaerobaculia bacterium]
MLRRLPRRCREVLHLRFFEEYSSEEIATHFATTIQYARKMVYRCVCAAHLVLARITLRRGRP